MCSCGCNSQGSCKNRTRISVLNQSSGCGCVRIESSCNGSITKYNMAGVTKVLLFSDDCSRVVNVTNYGQPGDILVMVSSSRAEWKSPQELGLVTTTRTIKVAIDQEGQTDFVNVIPENTSVHSLFIDGLYQEPDEQYEVIGRSVVWKGQETLKPIYKLLIQLNVNS